MKQLLYLAFHDRLNSLYGVQAKIESQCRAFGAYGYRVDLLERRGEETVLLSGGAVPEPVARHPHRLRSRAIRSVLDKQAQIRDIKRWLHGRHYDACYIRYDFSDPGFLSLLQTCRRVCHTIVLELPTFPYDEENKSGILSRAKLLLDQCCRTRLHRYVDWIVTFYGGHQKIFGIPVLVIPNGFDFSSMQPVTQALPADAIHIIAVSSMREWHGYERFLEGMRDYYHPGAGDRRNLVLHLVGNGREYGKYQALVEAYGLRDHVVMEGAMHGQALDALYERCALGIDSLARHRSGISVLSSLKSREYGSKGLPMINSCKIDILDGDFPYLLQVPADESPIKMQAVVDFYDRCFSTGKSRTEVAREIRSYVEARTGMKQTLADVVRVLEAPQGARV